MTQFAGFPSGKVRSTPVPAPFFTELLPQIDHLGELKVTLYALWFLDRQEGQIRLTLNDFTSDRKLLLALHPYPDEARLALTDALARVVSRGTLLEASLKNEENEFKLYFLNSAKGRAALKALQKGDWQPELGMRTPVQLELERPNIYRLYEENIGPLTPLIADALREAEMIYHPEWIEEAMRKAVLNNARHWRYIEAILTRWKEKGRDDTDRREFLRKIAADISKANSPTSSSTEPEQLDLSGDPNCPVCHGVGFIRQDLPVVHPDFGKLQLCSCRQKGAADAVHQRLYRMSNLEAFRSMTFENFTTQGRLGLGDDQVGSLKYALNQATHFAHSLKGWLLFLGGYGVGKTHLAAAIANFVVGVGVPTLFLTVPDLLDWLRFAYDATDSTFEERFDEIRNIPLLVLDDLGTQNTTAWAQEKLYQIINHRYVNRLSTVITTNQQLNEIDGRIRSRLEDPDLVTRAFINAPDFRSPLRDTSQPALSTLHLHANQTFGNFSLRETEKLPAEEQQSLAKAFRAAQQFAEKPRGWLVLLGKTFTGKTHLAAAVGNYRHKLGDSPMFVVVPDLLDHLRATFSPTSSISYDDLFNQVRTVSLLILDDLGTQSASPWAKEKLYQIFNYRYNAELPTVITTAMTMEEMDPRIQSRMLDTRLCTPFALLVAPFRGGAGSRARTRRARQSTSD